MAAVERGAVGIGDGELAKIIRGEDLALTESWERQAGQTVAAPETLDLRAGGGVDHHGEVEITEREDSFSAATLRRT